ncbi:C4-dicarboxylate transporter/malic acid transport protein [Acidithiobacillus ferrivorans]|uniref:C4-dicarboxylate transporter/malic acid transport protein n=1 Tax=Acidithiobacillus ferrivorans TaxID=160808 RepID=A0A060UMM9_9PROT|nr:tellurite resistance/C4-dicarboxylate transporter family protein [Acidithiobacillus ferrivorans]CDQ09902.1 C4-dicarboxylate transporter/malic acid transport protein [Acidithiobacillus ferrivorans]SMH65772.1 C4-dicarboxylate transporter/malic acid transport protein [Acidithiobacillus ferrivorans]
MERNGRGLPRLLDAAVQDLAPAYFALVMATGIVSLAAQAMSIPLLARSLFWLNGTFYGVLWFLTVWRMLRFGQRLSADIKDYQRGAGFFSVVAGSAILGDQFILLANDEMAGMLLWGLAMALWLLLNYGIFTAFTIQKHKPSLEDGITGTWLLAVVAAQSIAVLAALLDAHWNPMHRLEFNFVALSLWLWGGMLYIWIIVLIFYRYSFFPFAAEDLVPPYWVNMGAMAISTLAGSLLIDNAAKAPYLHSLLPFLKGFTVFYWVTGSWWIPLLVALEIWRHGIKRLPIRYDPLYWSLVFPLGMYSLCTIHMAQSMDLPFLLPLGHIFFYLALLAWAITLYGMIRRMVFNCSLVRG